MGQSSNDSFPTAMHIATVLNTKEQLIPALKNLYKILEGKSQAWHKYVKIDRTHLKW